MDKLKPDVAAPREAGGSNIASFSQGDLRRFIVNLLHSDPGAVPSTAIDETTLLPRNPLDGDFPVWDRASQRWVPSSQHAPSTVVTSLPSSPIDGQEVYYAADAGSGVIWHLRYRAASGSSFKWEYVGGPPLHASVLADESTASTSYVALTTAGPSITLPLQGDYLVEQGANVYGTAGFSSLMSYDIGGTGASDNDCVANAGGDANEHSHIMREQRKNGLGTVALVSKYRVFSGTCNWRWRWLTVTPIRVST